ncbi:LURP-one-related 15 protein [Nymphaea thermarum]|nr:LURP-one-related 15 protein [Nymphaea thermarum]
MRPQIFPSLLYSKKLPIDIRASLFLCCAFRVEYCIYRSVKGFMSRVFPGAENELPPLLPSPSATATRPISGPSSFTVWKKSSMSFDCMDGFTVLDSCGRLVFRVDNYQSGCPCLTREVVLMDGKGTPLFTLRRRRQWGGLVVAWALRNLIELPVRQRSASLHKPPWFSSGLIISGAQFANRKSDVQGVRTFQGFSLKLLIVFWLPLSHQIVLPQILSMHERWDGFKGETDSRGIQTRQLFSIKKWDVVRNKRQAVVFIGENFPVPAFYIEGDYNKRSCKIRLAATREVAAEICRKQVNPAIMLGRDVFSLIVRPGFDNEMMMAFIIVMDRINRTPLFIPALCC